ncbi:MAG: acetyl-CoA carboxylase carboxyltransferase subunit alpha [Chloroflexi bacterium]|nr:acetyl-CoA carboxylase carboxyltransferase subunit alpha [Chloroflexota bacterium]
MGSVVGEKIALAFELAVKKKLPVVTVATSGGARMQEGMLSLAQMAKTAAATQRLHAAGLPYVSVLANPTTGGVFASFASLGDIIIAEPRALIGFAGPRVVEQTLGIRLPPGSHTAEFLLAHGMIDKIVDRERLRDLLMVLVKLLMTRQRLVAAHGEGQTPAKTEHPAVSAWKTVQLARHQQRPTSLDYIGRLFSSFVELHGDRLFGDDPAIVGGLADLNGQVVVVIGQERGHGEYSAEHNSGRARPEGYRKALRLMEMAVAFHLPLVTFIDTPGAYPGLESEERGLASALAHCLARLSELPTPVIAVVIGEGGSGGALALGVADRVLMLENAIYSVIAPEGAATILYRDASKAEEVAPALKLTAHDCRELGVVDLVVPEPEGGAHRDHDRAAWLLKEVLVEQLLQVESEPVARLVKERYRKYRRMGEYGTYFLDALSRELAQLQENLGRRIGGLRERLPRRTAENVESGSTPDSTGSI